MTKLEKQKEIREKILYGLSLVYAEVVKFKKYKGTDIVIMKDGKIVKFKPK
jgi:hypothetical protein